MIPENDIFKKYKWVFFTVLYFHLFGLYMIPSVDGPDTDVYIRTAESVIDGGTINLLDSSPLQVTKTSHFPITQAIGGVVFTIPAILAGRLTYGFSSCFFPESSPFNELNFHYEFWVGFISFHILLLTCYLMYRICIRYFPGKASLSALAAGCIGGPLFLYSTMFPLSMNFLACFMAVLLLYVFVSSDKKKEFTWMQIGIICGVGSLIRNEFIIWTLLPLAFLVKTIYMEKNRLPIVYVICSFLLFFILGLTPDFLIRFTLYGEFRSPYPAQFDLNLLFQMPAMLFGGRNGLFSFWPVLLVFLAGYFIFIKKNAKLFHILAVIVLADFILISFKPFWSGEIGAHIGQRNILMVMPCFILFGARLFDQLKKWYPIIISVCIIFIIWTSLVTAVYGIGWQSESLDDPVFLMHHHFPDLFITVVTNFPRFVGRAYDYLLSQRFDFSFVVAFPLSFLFFAITEVKRKFKISVKPYAPYALTVFFSVISLVSIIFLAGAKDRGIAAFKKLEQEDPGRHIIRNSEYDLHNEVIGYSVDIVSYFLELDKNDTALYFENKFMRILSKIDEGYTEDFRLICEGLRLRKKMGWERLVPEQDHWSVKRWYLENKDNVLSK